MAQQATSGYGAYVGYGFETTYATSVAATRTFGHGAKISVSRRNNMERIFGVGARNATANSAKKYEGTATVDFVLSHGTFFRAVLGQVADSGAGPYAHTYTETNTIPSFTIATGAELGSNDSVSLLKGCKVSRATVTTAIDEVVSVKLECPYSTETLATSGIGSQTAATEDPFTFAEGTLSVGGTTIGYVQSVEFTVDEDLELVWGIGARTATYGVEKQRKYDFKINAAFTDVSLLLQTFLGSATAPLATTTPASVACVLTFTNGGASTAIRSIVCTFANLYIDEDTLPFDSKEIIKEDITAWALSCTSIVWNNNTAADNANP